MKLSLGSLTRFYRISRGLHLKSIPKLLLLVILGSSQAIAVPATRATSATPAHQAMTTLSQARSKAEQGDLQEAVALYQKTLRLDDKLIEARKELSELLILLNLNDPHAEDPSQILEASHPKEDLS